tara:strand:- start:89 stop:355 length:267 start_codon:yes stop_codon:yes gene_type:complete
MFKKTFNLIFFFSIIIFIYSVFSVYFSDSHIKKINKNRKDHQLLVDIDNYNIPILESDTKNVIIYGDEQLIKKDLKKRKFWELLNKNE